MQADGGGMAPTSGKRIYDLIEGVFRMKDTDLFQMAFGLLPPWLVADCRFTPGAKRLDLYIDFPRGSVFACPACGREDVKAYDTQEKTWRHLNFFEHETYIHARVPRTDCPDCGVKTANVPWARPGSGFTLLFEAFVMAMAKEMPVNAVARAAAIQDTRLWRIIHHFVEEARRGEDFSRVAKVGMDETASRRGHNYISIFVDMERAKVIFATPGKDASTVESFVQDLEKHNGNREGVKEACCDMSQAFISGIQTSLPNAEVTFDKFHVVKIVNAAVDQVRREERKDRQELKGSRYIWLKNPERLKPRELADLGRLRKRKLKTARAHQIKLTFQDLYKENKASAETFLKEWYFWATHCRLEPMIEAAKTIKRHWNGVLRWFESKINNGILEGINSLVQAAKAKARGYRSNRNLIAMTYMVAGKLNFNLPT
jgi:transposase